MIASKNILMKNKENKLKYTVVKSGNSEWAVVEIEKYKLWSQSIFDMSGKIIGYCKYNISTKHGWADERMEQEKNFQRNFTRKYKNKKDITLYTERVQTYNKYNEIMPIYKNHEIGDIVSCRIYG